ncbi:MAG: hypothetical protein IPH89_02520 [Bacteroidetes bacterium]|nr:hypothetical protein [Bacteroidota bacterium]
MPGRQYTGATGYRYGFGGQEKDDEIKGVGNSYTAEFWQYDTRLGRRWNRDPVIKPWRSSYDAFDNNPIWKIDPNGDDDYFNSDGTFSHSTKKGTKILVITKDAPEGKSYTTFATLHSTENRKAVQSIAQYYASKVGMNAALGVDHRKPNKGGKDGNILAYYSKKNDWAALNTNGGGIAPDFDDYENLISVFEHEKKHKETGYGNYGLEHAKVYLLALEEESFKAVGNDPVRKDAVLGQVAAAAGFISEEVNELGNSDEAQNIVDRFNKLSDKTGLILNPVRNGDLASPDFGKYSIEIYEAPKTKKK